jgi:hypothetical protein
MVKPESMWLSHTLKLVVLVFLVAAFIIIPPSLQPRIKVEPHWGDGGVNWFGQGPVFALFFAVALLILLCSLRFLIIANVRCPIDAFAWYLLLLASLLPTVWLLVVYDWDNEAGSDIAIWVGTPVALLFVPTAFACYDLVTNTRLTAWPYIARSLIEVIILVPTWAYIWVVFFMFFLLGWVGL